MRKTQPLFKEAFHRQHSHQTFPRSRFTSSSEEAKVLSVRSHGASRPIVPMRRTPPISKGEYRDPAFEGEAKEIWIEREDRDPRFEAEEAKTVLLHDERFGIEPEEDGDDEFARGDRECGGGEM